MSAVNPNRWSRRAFLKTVAAASAGVSFPRILPAATRAQTGRPLNVLLIGADDLRGELGCPGGWFVARTPHLDALAASGVRFDRAYCQFPLCNPSRVSMLTGRNPTRTGVLGNRANFRVAHPDWTTLPQLFKQNGYVTARAGKIFHGGIDDAASWSAVSDPDGRTADVPPSSPSAAYRAANSDRIVVLDGDGEAHGDYRTADRTIANLRKYKDRPFFIGCGFVKPHSPPSAPQRFFDLYDVDEIKLTPDFAPWPTVPPGFPPAAIRSRNADLFIGRVATETGAREVIRAYLASASWMDWNVGRVLAELDRLGLRDNTVIAFFGDNGYQLGEKGRWSKAGSLFEMGTRVPLILAAPRRRGNGRPSPRIVELLDLYPSLIELCGLPPQHELEGASLVPLLNRSSARWDKPAHSVWSEDGRTLHGVAVRVPQWRYAEFGPDGVNGAMLFDVNRDPLEMTNLANDPKHKSTRAELSALARRYAANLRQT